MVEYKRKCSRVILTEDGLYHEGHVPSSYSGASLSIEVVHRILFIGFNGDIQVFACNPPKAKNSAGQEIPYPENAVYVVTAEASPAGGDGDIPFKDGAHYLPASLIQEADARIAALEKDPNVKVF